MLIKSPQFGAQFYKIWTECPFWTFGLFVCKNDSVDKSKRMLSIWKKKSYLFSKNQLQDHAQNVVIHVIMTQIQDWNREFGKSKWWSIINIEFTSSLKGNFKTASLGTKLLRLKFVNQICANLSVLLLEPSSNASCPQVPVPAVPMIRQSV